MKIKDIADFHKIDESDVLKIYSSLLGIEVKVGGVYLSPVRSERRPSFSVYRRADGRILWKDFGGDMSGDVISLYLSLKGLGNDIPEALSQMCEIIDKEYEPFEMSDEERREHAQKKEKEDRRSQVMKIYSDILSRNLENDVKINRAAEVWSDARLRQKDMYSEVENPYRVMNAASYLEKRGIKEKVYKDLEIGCGKPQDLEKLLNAGVKIEEIEEYGLGVFKRDNDGIIGKGFLYMTDRVTTPVKDSRGKLKGFLGRIVEPEKIAGFEDVYNEMKQKIIPDEGLPLISKYHCTKGAKVRDRLYGEFLRKRKVAKSRQEETVYMLCFIVKGRMDVCKTFSDFPRSVIDCVSSQGRLSKSQINELKREMKSQGKIKTLPIVFFEDSEKGRREAQMISLQLSREGIDHRIARPKGNFKDITGLRGEVERKEKEGMYFGEGVLGSLHLLKHHEFVYSILRKQIRSNDAQKRYLAKKEFIMQVGDEVKVSDPLSRGEILEFMSEKLKMSREEIKGIYKGAYRYPETELVVDYSSLERHFEHLGEEVLLSIREVKNEDSNTAIKEPKTLSEERELKLISYAISNNTRDQKVLNEIENPSYKKIYLKYMRDTLNEASVKELSEIGEKITREEIKEIWKTKSVPVTR